MSERTVFRSIPHQHVVSLPPQASVWDAACVMTKASVVLGISRLARQPEKFRVSFRSEKLCRVKFAAL